MTENDKSLFFKLLLGDTAGENSLCDTDVSNISDISLYELFGAVVLNRLSGVVYKNLLDSGQISRFPREFGVALSDLYAVNVRKNESFYTALRMLADILSPAQKKYAALKGAYLCGYYPKGCRTSNDIDLLCADNRVTEIGNLLCENGFVRGYVRNGILVPASRRDIVSSKMLRGETVPFIRQIDLPYMKYLEVDLNFSSDFKSEERSKAESMVEASRTVETEGVCFPVLSKSDFFIHLCEHLYKEAAALPWLEMRRDMTLYKYYDIYCLIKDFDPCELEMLRKRISVLGCEVPCLYGLWSCASLFGYSTPAFERLYGSLKTENCDFLHTVCDPENRKNYIFCEKDLKKRFWHSNRKELLKEI